jgi:RHS repeat-associated protein
MPGRKYNTGNYRHGFNGKENDREWGDQLIQDYGFRLYNPAIGKFLSVDPLAPSYPYYTPYQFAGNMPIVAIDLDGLEEFIVLRVFSKEGIYLSTLILETHTNLRDKTAPKFLVVETEKGSDWIKYAGLHQNTTENKGINHFRDFSKASEFAKELFLNFNRENGSYTLKEDVGTSLSQAVNDTERKVVEGLGSSASVAGIYRRALVKYHKESIFFEYADADPLPSKYFAKNKGLLERVKNQLDKNPDLKLRVEGYASSDADDSRNMKLSQDRAANFMEYLIKSKVVTSDRIISVGYGETQADQTVDKPEDKRVDFKFYI